MLDMSSKDFGPNDYIKHITQSQRHINHKKAFKLPKNYSIPNKKDRLIQTIADKIFEKHKSDYVRVSRKKIFEFTERQLRNVKTIQPDVIDQVEKKILNIIQNVGDATL